MELKPCPFCGSNNIEIYPTGYGRPPKWAVMCGNCQAEGPVDLGESGAIEQWNTRPSEKEYEIEFDNYVRECGRLQIEKDAAEAQVIELLRYKTGFDEAMRRLEAAEARAAELERVLRMVEWSSTGVDRVITICPWCRNANYQGHSDNCPRQKALGEP